MFLTHPMDWARSTGKDSSKIHKLLAIFFIHYNLYLDVPQPANAFTEAALSDHATSTRPSTMPIFESWNSSPAMKQEPLRVPQHAPYAGEIWRRAKISLVDLKPQPSLQRPSPAVAMARSRASASASTQRKTLRRRSSPEARARAALRTIELLRAAYTAYRALLESADAATLKRLAALKRDYVAWLTFLRTGELPPRALSEPLRLPTLHPDDYPWMAHLAPGQLREVEAAMTAFREYMRRRLHLRAERAHWLAQPDPTGERRALFELMREGFNIVGKHRKTALAALKAAQASKQQQQQQLTPAGAPAAETGAPKRKAPAVGGKRVHEKPLLQYLTPDQQKRAQDLLPSHNEYKRLQRFPEKRDAWLAADDEQRFNHARYGQLYKDYKEYQRLYRTAMITRQAARRGGQTADAGQVSGSEGMTSRASDAHHSVVVGADNAAQTTYPPRLRMSLRLRLLRRQLEIPVTIPLLKLTSPTV